MMPNLSMTPIAWVLIDMIIFTIMLVALVAAAFIAGWEAKADQEHKKRDK